MGEKSLNLKFEKRLLQYSLMAGAVMMTAVDAEAQVYGTLVDQDIIHSSYVLYFNGEHQIRIGHFQNTTVGRGIFSVFGAYPDFSWIRKSNSTYQLKALTSGYVVNSTKNFVHQAAVDFANTNHGAWTHGSATFRNKTNTVGIRFKLSGQPDYNYGWVKFSVANDFSSIHLISYAWEQTQGVGITADGALPVQLTSFFVNKESDKINLTWKTATEVNNYGFEVQRSANSQQLSAETWEKIGFVPGSGTSNSPKEYSYDDKTAPTGKVQYRLKQIDNDGKYEYSDIVTVENKITSNYSLEQNYPNPFNPSTVITYQLPAEEKITLKIYDVLGREVKTLVNETQSAGTHKVNFSTAGENLAAGMYIYKLQAGSFTETKKMLMIK